jgi:hypothetical protein
MSARFRQAGRALAGEAGIAVPIALSVMLTTLLLATVATTIAISTNQTSTRDNSSKAAIEAADAGLRAAIYRLNVYQPASNYCPTEPTNYQAGASASGAPTATLCPPDGPDVPQGLGNGATYSYWISRSMQSGDTCIGPSVSSSQGTVSQRCITGVGTAGGVSARVQERVAAYTSTPAFPTAIFGTKAVTVLNNVTITSDTPNTPALLGTNGILTVGGTGGGTTLIDGFQLPPGATSKIGSNVTDVGPTTGISTQYANPTPLYPTETATNTYTPYLTSTTQQAGTCSQTEAQNLYGWAGTWVPTNCNYEIQRGIDNSLCLNNGATVRDCDVSTKLPSADFSLANRTLYLPNNSSLVLGGGYYNFCSLFLDNNSQITITGGQATIMIDSPSDPTSNCPKTSTTFGGNTILPGTFTMNQNSTINATSALNAQILVWGDQSNVPPQNTVSLNNNGSSTFALIAPFSNVSMSPSNNTTFRGAIIGYTVTLGNASHFTYEADTQSFQSTSLPIYYPSYWEQCPAQSSGGTDPTTGC